MPVVSARSRSSDSARICLPSSVNRSISPVADDDDDADDDRRPAACWPIESPRNSTVAVLLTSRLSDSVPQLELDRRADQEREPDRHQHQLQQPGALAAHRRPHDLLGERSRAPRSIDHREAGSRPERQRPGDVRQVGHVGAEGEEVAVGEVDQLEDPVDERQADGAERVDRAGREPVEAGLGDRVQALGGDHREHQDGEDDQRRARRMPPGGLLERRDADSSSPTASAPASIRADPIPSRRAVSLNGPTSRDGGDHRVGELGRRGVAAEVGV